LSNHCCSGKAIGIAYPEGVFVALGIQHAMHMRLVILSSVASPVVPHFDTLPHKRHNFRECVIEGKMCVDVLYYTRMFERFLILRTIHRGTVINVRGSSCKVLVIFVRL
jgi:hypothetical protein